MDCCTSQNSNGQKPDLAKNGDTPIKIDVDTLFTLKTPNGELSETGVRDLNEYMIRQGLGYLPDDFEPVWATRRGTIPKRLTNHCYKRHQIKLTPSQVSELGNIARRNASDAKTYILDFNRTIDWSHGDFGDRGSCYWGDKIGALDMIRDNGGYAIRAWKMNTTLPDGERPLTYDNVSGYARAWIAPISDNRLVLWNGYGETSLTFARLLALKFACAYKRISLTNNGSDGGTLWINGGGSSYIIGAWPKIEKVTDHDLQWEESDDDYVVCHACDERLSEDTRYLAYARSGAEYYYCGDCSFECARCGNYYSDDQRNSRGCDYYCRECYGNVLAEAEAEAEAESLRIALEAEENVEVAYED
jgi:hypothetical protein